MNKVSTGNPVAAEPATIEPATAEPATIKPANQSPASPDDQVLNAVQNAANDSPIIVDFDETLFLRNSTQAYLGSIYPRPVGAAFLIVTKAIKPWRFFPGAFKTNNISKDWLLVVTATLLFPWTVIVWHWRAKALATTYCNQPLAQAIENNAESPIIIATLGFGFIVKPLIKHLPIASVITDRTQIVACRFWRGAADRAAGKLKMVLATLDEVSIRKAVVVTDSTADQPILDVAATPCLIVWPKAEFVPAMADLYIPFFYSEKVKNPGKSHFIKQVLFGHWFFGVVAWSCISAHPLLNALALFFLTLSYWCVYEIGYQENDDVGEKYESKPTLSAAYQQQTYPVKLNTLWPWLYAIAFAIPGCILFALSQSASQPAIPLSIASAQLYPPQLYSAIFSEWISTPLGSVILTNGLRWLVYLVVVRSCFWFYNQLNEVTRIWMYPLLQAQRLFGFGVLASTNAVGAMLLASFVTSRWIQYCIYRCGGDRTRFPINVGCLLLFTLLFSALAFSAAPLSDWITGQAALAFIYCTLRAAGKLSQLKPQIGLIKVKSD
ncbi:MAG: hypothetical protein WA783_10875 [Phormidesmis sp.]